MILFPYILVFLGGTGEGKQHLGSDGKIPNKQVAIPEIQSGYDTPPNPCPVNAKVKGQLQLMFNISVGIKPFVPSSVVDGYICECGI